MFIPIFSIVPSRTKPIFIRLSRTFCRLIKLYGVNKYLNALSPLFIEMLSDFADFSRSRYTLNFEIFHEHHIYFFTRIIVLRRNLLLNGLFAVFDHLRLRDLQHMHLSMNSSSRVLLSELKELHASDFKYFGEV